LKVSKKYKIDDKFSKISVTRNFINIEKSKNNKKKLELNILKGKKFKEIYSFSLLSMENTFLKIKANYL